MFNGQALVLLVFLLPGFLSMAILDMLIPPAKRDDIPKIINALILSLIIYGIYSLKFTDYPIAMVAKTVDTWGRLDFAHNNAGVMGGSPSATRRTMSVVQPV